MKMKFDKSNFQDDLKAEFQNIQTETSNTDELVDKDYKTLTIIIYRHASKVLTKTKPKYIQPWFNDKLANEGVR